jgi:hypothetical protein
LDECHYGMFILGFARPATAARLKADNERRSVFLESTHDFTDALKIGMTAAEVDAAEKESFHNPAGWGRTANTTVTGNGTTEQWGISTMVCLLPSRNSISRLGVSSFGLSGCE